MATTPIGRVTITAHQIQLFLSTTNERACVLAALFNKIFPAYQLTTLPRVRMAIAQMAHESAGFTRYVENLNYSAQGLANTWPLRFASNPNARVKVPNKKAILLARKPQQIANEVYGNRMGNTEPNDGWNLRGSGAIQNTGKDNIGAYAAYKGFTSVYDTARLMRESDEYAIDSACWYLVIRKNLLDEMDRGHIEHVTTAINGGLIGIEERSLLFAKANKYII